MRTPDKQKCRQCRGRGVIVLKRGQKKRPCPACNGNGKGYATK